MATHIPKEHSSTVPEIAPEWFWRLELARTDGPTEDCKMQDISGWFKNNEGGPYLRAFERCFAEWIQAQNAIGVSSGSAAIYTALKACGLGGGDSVAVPTYTHVGSVAPIVLAGAKPLFIDVDHYGNLDPDDLEMRKNEYDAVLVVHQLGIPCEMKKIQSVAGSNPIIEDASHALGSIYQNGNCGLIGDIGCFSIGGGTTKIVCTGEGGMIVTNNDVLAEKCRKLRNHGDRSFDAPYFCFNFRMSEIPAAIGLLQMDKLDSLIHWQIQNARTMIANLPDYLEVLPDPVGAEPNRYLIGCHFNSFKAGMTRERFLQLMYDYQIGPRKYIGGGYSKLVSDVKFYSPFAKRGEKFPMSEFLRDSAVWIDWHRYPRTTEEVQTLLAALQEATL